MAIKIIKYYILFLVMFFSWTNFASASLKITEVMYDPEGTDTNREWIKLYNDGSEIINIISGKTASAWRFSGGEKTETLHYINDPLDIEPGKYAIIASNKNTFIEEYPSFSGPVADTSMSLNNTEGIVKIWDGSNPRNIVASLEYNANDSTNDNNIDNIADNISNDNSFNTISTSSKNTVPEILKITTKIISPKIVTAGIPFSFNSLTTTNWDQTYAVGKFIWNFGDGMVREVKDATPFDYIYDYPGEYYVTLSYFDNSFNKVADSLDKITLKVVEASIYISSVGNDSDPFIELENKSNYEIVLSSWIINGGNHYFVIPNGTIILPNKKIKLSPKITGFTGDDIRSVIITNPSKETITTYPTIEKQKLTQKNTLTYAIAQNNVSSLVKNDLQDNVLSKDSQVINLNDLGGSVESSGVNIPNSTYAWIGLFIIIGLGVTSFWFIKRKNNVDDYVDKEIRAEDMTIVE